MLISGDLKQAYISTINKAVAYQICASLDKRVDLTEINRRLVELYRYRTMNDERSLSDSMQRFDDMLNVLISDCNSSTRSDITRFTLDMQQSNTVDSAIEEINRRIGLILQTTEHIADTMQFGVTRKNQPVSTQIEPIQPETTTKPELPPKTKTRTIYAPQPTGKEIPPDTYIPEITPEFREELQSLYKDTKLTTRILLHFNTLQHHTGLTSEGVVEQMELDDLDAQRVSSTLSNLYKQGKILRIKEAGIYYYYIDETIEIPTGYQKSPSKQAIIRYLNHFPVNTVFSSVRIGQDLDVPESSMGWLRNMLLDIYKEGLIEREVEKKAYVYWRSRDIPEDGQ